jgi:hypothetical protein
MHTLESVTQANQKYNNFKVTIITVYKDNIKDLFMTGASISNFPCEWVIVNGGKLDHEELIRSQFNLRIRYLPGPDKGIYDGMNKGLKIASGEYVWFLNSGDIAVRSSFDKLLKILNNTSNHKILLYRQFNRETGRKSHRLYFPKWILKFALFPIPHQGAVFNKDVISEMGGYKENLGTIADQILIYDVLSQFKPRIINDYLSIFQGNGTGSKNTSENFEKCMQEYSLGRHRVKLTWIRGIYKAFRKAA